MKNKPEVVTVPANLEAERAILGSILLDNRVLDEVAESLKGREFYLAQHKKAFEHMLALGEASAPIDLVTLTESLHKKGDLEVAGGVAYVSTLADGLPKVSNLKHYIGILKDKFILRELLDISGYLEDNVLEGENEAETIIGSVEKSLFRLALECAGKRAVGKTTAEARVSFLNSLEKQSLLRVYSGLRDLDKATGGFRAGELITITASATGSGKTLFAQQIKEYACKAGLHGIYFSGEMLAEQLAARELATEASVEHWKMRRPEALSKDDYTKLVEVAAASCKICRTVDGEFSVRDLRTASRRMKGSGNLSWIIVDYDELVDAPGKDEFAQQRYVIREAKRIAMILEVPVLMISGIRKPLDSKEAKRPRLEQVYGSGAKSKHSTCVIFIDREYVRELKGDEAEAQICILKSRNGKVGYIPCSFNLKTLRFENKEPEPAPKPKRHYTEEKEE